MFSNHFRQKIFTSISFQQSGVRMFCNALSVGKDLSSTDILLNKFKHANSTESVLDIVNQHNNVMNAKHIMQALRSLFILQKEGRSDLSTRAIIKNKDFIKLCGQLKKSAGIIDINQSIEALKVVTYVGVPGESTIVQVLLQLIRHNINDLSLSNIIFLEFLLHNYKVPLAEALRIALPIVFEIQLPFKIDRDNVLNLKQYLIFASKNKLSMKTINLILSSILNSGDNLDVQTTKSILWSLTQIPQSIEFEPLIKKCLDTILVYIDEISFEDLDITLSKLCYAYRKEYPFYSDKLFCDAVVGQLIDKNLGFTNSIFCIKKLDKLGITNKYLIDYTAKKIEEQNSSNFYLDNLYKIYIFMKYLSITNYRPSNWEDIKENIENLNLKDYHDLSWLKFGASLCYLQIFNKSIIEKAFNEDLEESLRKRKTYIYLYLIIKNSIKLFKPQMENLIPEYLEKESLIQYLSIPEELPLKAALLSAFGGEKYVKSELYSKECIFIDHAIIFRKGGFPVSTNCRSQFIEDIEIPPEHQVVLIMGLHSEYFTQEKYLKMGPSLNIKVLENRGYTCLPISLDTWTSLGDYEKIPYLVQNIKNKLGQDMTLNSFG